MYLGFEHSTRSGSSIGVDDFVIPEEKPSIIDAAEKEVKSLNHNMSLVLLPKVRDTTK